MITRQQILIGEIPHLIHIIHDNTPECQRLIDILELSGMTVSQSRATPTGRNRKRKVSFRGIRFKILMQHFAHTENWFAIQSEISVIIADCIQDLTNFFFAHDCFRETFAAGGTFAVAFTQDFDCAFFFLDFFLDASLVELVREVQFPGFAFWTDFLCGRFNEFVVQHV
jgi:hypothetical protein